MLFRFLILVHVCAAFPLKCPEPAQWSFRARSHCRDPSKYFCLKNDLINGYSENCTVSDFLKSGRKHVIRGGLDADICSTERFQPSSLNFYTNVSTNCIFLKSTCNEEGQVINDIGTRNTDSTCKCDYTNGYDFLVKPRNQCFCIPSEEDCSCYSTTCLDFTFKLSPDYECIYSEMNISMTKCRPITNERDIKDKNQRQTRHLSIPANISYTVTWNILATQSILVFIIVSSLVIICGSKISKKYYMNVHLILEPDDFITVIEGQSVSLKYKLLINKFAIEFKRNNCSMGEAKNIHINKEGRSKTLTISNIALTDGGEYSVEVATITSKTTRLIVKPLFKRQLENTKSVDGSDTLFECETEKVNENYIVDWFKDDIKITADNTEKLETKDGYIYKLTIKNTSLQDSGSYRIEINGIRSEAVLDVKALFKRQLENTKSVDGSDTLFECETEKVNENYIVDWFKDDIKITADNTEKLETKDGYIYKLTIKNTNLQDSGSYRIEINGIRSEAVLDVKALFKRQLKDIKTVEGRHTIFECETEKDKGDVEWFKDDVKMTGKLVERETVQTEEGQIYKLIIRYTNINDSGLYRIEKNGIRSEAALEVKALFKKPLKMEQVLEGADIVFECETEKEGGDVEWFNGADKIIDNMENMETTEGYIYKMTIKSVRKSGTYKIIKNGICSEATLKVKALFIRKLENTTIMEGLDIQFDCKTEEDNGYVEWYKNDVLIKMSTGNIEMKKLPGNIHKLTISPATLHDSGRYRIEKNMISSEAVLDVKEMPETIKQMSKHDREEFLKATKSGTTQRYYIRVMIIGEGSAGKTCLLRRLMNQDIKDVQSTDGLDIERRKCHIDIKTGEWHFPKIDGYSYSVWTDQNNQLADCGFWDFAGQKEFYATHQTFLSTNAVYLLVADTSKDLTKKTYNDMIEDKFDYLGEYIDFWLDNVHCYKKDVHNAQGQVSVNLNPPVIMVGTGIDKITLDKRKDKEQNFQDHLHKTLSNHEKRRHLRKTHFLSNKSPSDNREEFKKLREEILINAKSLKNWGDNLPSRWIVLEKVIHSKISEANYTMSYAEAIELAAQSSFPDLKQTTSELDSFLNYEHDIGNIIFFDDVKDFIVLDPKWLVDVFKCFVSNQYGNELINMTEWSELKNKGKLMDKLVNKLLEKVSHLSLIKHKKFVLQIMEKFDIIVKPINDEASGIFYMPCLIKPTTLDAIFKDIGAENCKKKTSWFMLEFDFLPPSYFNHILVSFVKEKKLSTKKDNQLCIYRNIGLFNINESGTRVLMICLSQNAIAMQVLQWNIESHCYSDIKSKLTDLVHSMKQRYRIHITYTNKFKCSDGNCFEKKGRVDLDTVMAESEYRCTEHKGTHLRTEIIKSWLTEKEIEEEYKIKGYTMCNLCLNISMYKCYDCNTVLCKDCFKKHDEENNYKIHSIQPVSDKLLLNNIFNIGDDSIKDIECLPTGKIIVAKIHLSQIISYSVNLIKKQVIQLEDRPMKMDVMYENTVAVSLRSNGVAIVDIQQSHVRYIRNVAMQYSSFTFLFIENEFYILSEEFYIVVIDMSGSVKRRIKLSFTPYDMCYDSVSQHICCINSDNSQLIFIDRDGNDIFIFTDPSMTNLKSITIDNEGSVLVLCRKGDLGYSVMKVDSNGDKSEVVITNIKALNDGLRICYDHLTNSVVIGTHDTVYIYKKK